MNNNKYVTWSSQEGNSIGGQKLFCMVLLLSSSKCYIIKKVLAPLKFYNAE